MGGLSSIKLVHVYVLFFSIRKSCKIILLFHSCLSHSRNTYPNSFGDIFLTRTYFGKYLKEKYLSGLIKAIVLLQMF